MNRVKVELHELLSTGGDVDEDMVKKMNPTKVKSIKSALDKIKNPRAVLVCVVKRNH